MQLLLDNRKALSNSGWQIVDAADTATGTAVSTVNQAAASNMSASSNTGSSGGECLPHAVMLLLLQRECLLAGVERDMLKENYEKAAGDLRKCQQTIKLVRLCPCHPTSLMLCMC
jgi:hypothetical protein